MHVTQERHPLELHARMILGRPRAPLGAARKTKLQAPFVYARRNRGNAIAFTYQSVPGRLLRKQDLDIWLMAD